MLAINKENNPDREVTIHNVSAQEYIVKDCPYYFKNIESVDYMIDVFSSLNKIGFTFSKIANLNKFVNSVKGFMGSCEDPINSFGEVNNLPNEIIIKILATNSGFTGKETIAITETMQKINMNAVTRANMSIPGKVIDLKTFLSNENHAPTRGRMKFVDRLHAELQNSKTMAI